MLVTALGSASAVRSPRVAAFSALDSSEAELDPRPRVRLPLSPFLSPYSCSPLLSRVVQVAQPRWAGHRALVAPRSLALRELFLCYPLRRTTESPRGSFDARPRASPFSLGVSFPLVFVFVVAHVVPTRAPSLALRADLRSLCPVALHPRSHACFAPASKASLARSFVLALPVGL